MKRILLFAWLLIAGCDRAADKAAPAASLEVGGMSIDPSVVAQAPSAAPLAPAPSPSAAAPPKRELAPATAKRCAAIAQTQRRIFASYWGDLLGPHLLPQAPPPPATTAASPAPSPSAAAAAPALDVLPSAVASAAPAIDLQALDAATGEPPVPSWAGACMPTASGAWVMVLDDLYDTGMESVGGKWGLGYVDEKGKALFAPLSRSGYLQEAWTEGLSLEPEDSGDFDLFLDEGGYTFSSATFDWDGDGSEELFLRVETWRMRRTSSAGRIWTFRGGVLRLYGPTRLTNVSAVDDVDHDGRPDLVLTYGSETYISPRVMGSVTRGAVQGLSHSLPDGTFSRNDEVAQAFVRRSCPAPSANISTQMDVGCARIHGLSADAVVKRLERTCAKDMEAGECDALEELRDYAREEPPLVLTTGK